MLYSTELRGHTPVTSPEYSNSCPQGEMVAAMLARDRQKDWSEPSEGMDAEASLHGCIHGVFRPVLLMDSAR